MVTDENTPVAMIERDGKPLLVLQGTVDIFAVQDLAHAARSLLGQGQDALICCEKVQHLDCAALQTLLALKKALGAKGNKLQVVGKSPRVERLFEWAGLNE